MVLVSDYHMTIFFGLIDYFCFLSSTCITYFSVESKCFRKDQRHIVHIRILFIKVSNVHFIPCNNIVSCKHYFSQKHKISQIRSDTKIYILNRRRSIRLGKEYPREATEFMSGEGPGIFRGSLEFFSPSVRGGQNFFTLGQGGQEFFHAWSGGAITFLQQFFF